MVRWWATKQKNLCTYLAILKAVPGKKQTKKIINLDFEKIFDESLAKYLISKEFLQCIGCFSSYLLKSE